MTELSTRKKTQNPFELLVSGIGEHWPLSLELTKRDIEGRYRGSSLGIVWSALTPVLMLLVYILAFGWIMKSRWPGADNSITTFSLIIFAGLIIHGYFAECMTRASTLITANASYVKKVIFPLEILPWPMLLGALFHLGVNFLVLFCAMAVVGHPMSFTILWLPIVIAPLIVMMLGVSLALSALSVYFRDIGQIISPLVTAALFLSSAVVPVSSAPKAIQSVFRANPITLIIDQVRDVVLWSKQPDLAALGIYTLVAVIVAIVGAWLFQRMRGGFADVL